MSRPPNLSAIERVRNLMAFAYGDKPIGIPWKLFEAYANELQDSQTIIAAPDDKRGLRGLYAPAPGNDGKFTADGPRFVYPVIA